MFAAQLLQLWWWKDQFFSPGCKKSDFFCAKSNRSDLQRWQLWTVLTCCLKLFKTLFLRKNSIKKLKKLSNNFKGNGFNFQAEHFALPFIRILGSKHVQQWDCCTFARSALWVLCFSENLWRMKVRWHRKYRLYSV